jgi:hypothetical protein
MNRQLADFQGVLSSVILADTEKGLESACYNFRSRLITMCAMGVNVRKLVEEEIIKCRDVADKYKNSGNSEFIHQRDLSERVVGFLNSPFVRDTLILCVAGPGPASGPVAAGGPAAGPDAGGPVAAGGPAAGPPVFEYPPLPPSPRPAAFEYPPLPPSPRNNRKRKSKKSKRKSKTRRR